MHGGWTSALALEVHGPRFSNACTDLQRMYPSSRLWSSATPARPGSGIGAHVCGRHAASAQALELSTEVGQAHSRWRCTARGSPTRVPISNVCTQVSRLWSGTRLPPRPKHADLRARPVSHARGDRGKQPPPASATSRGNDRWHLSGEAGLQSPQRPAVDRDEPVM